MSGIVISTFNVGAASCGGCSGWDPSRFGTGCSDCSDVFRVFSAIFVLYLNDLPSEALSSTSSISSLQ